MQTSEASRIELILGDAVRLLVESGASADVVGPFALKFGAKIAQRLAVPDRPVQVEQTDIQKMIQLTVDAAVEKKLDTQLQAMSSKSVRLKVGNKNTLTTVSLPQVLMTKAIEHWGDKREAHAHIRAIFDQAPADAKVKSRWLYEEVKKTLAS